MTNAYLTDLVGRLEDSPTSQDLDYFLVAHARVGQLVATARGLAEEAESRYRVAKATAYAEARRSGAKSAGDADAQATIDAADSESAAISAREKYQKLAALHRSIEEVINGIKHLNRNDGMMTLPRR